MIPPLISRNYAIKPRVDALNECGVLKVSWLFKIALTLALSHVEREKIFGFSPFSM